MPRVCVIIPAYNATRTIERTLRSAAGQTYADLEIFVVDDGSTDGTGDLARRVSGDDKRITILRQNNAGVAAARNLALARTSCALTTWLDADDIWHPRKIERQLEVFEASGRTASLVYTGYRLIDDDDRIIPNFRTLVDVSGHTICRQIATNFFSNVSSIMVPTPLARQFGGHDPGLRARGIEGAEDLLLQLQLSSIGPVACCREALVGYRMHASNMSLSHARAARSNIRAIDMVAERVSGIPDWVIRMGRARTAGYVFHLARNGNLPAAFSLLGELLRKQPGYTALALALILSWTIRSALGLGPKRDPDVGRMFADADPRSAPWEDHMILTRRHRRALDLADRARSDRVGSASGFDLPADNRGTGSFQTNANASAPRQ
jgi:hypothetical protein